MKRSLVSGGAGFIGSHLCKFLLERGDEVICLDNFFTGSKNNLLLCMGHPHFELIRHDVTVPILLEVDEIYNLACPASPIHYQHNGVKTIETSVLGALNMLDLAFRVGAKILQASTSEVYGDPLEHPQSESYWGNVNPVGLSRSCYDEGKRCAESLFVNFQKHLGVKIKIIRIFNTYGENMAINDGRVISNFIVQALRNEDITIYGDGSQTRSFQYVSDLISGMTKMMDSRDDFFGPVNIGNPNEYTIGELAKSIIELTESKSKIIYLPLPDDDPRRRNPDITLAKKELDWEPRVGLVDGLKRTISYFRSII